MTDLTVNVEPQDITSLHVGRRASGETAIQIAGTGLVIVIDLTPDQHRDLVDQLMTTAVNR